MRPSRLWGSKSAPREDRGYPPVTIRGGRLRGGEVVLQNIESSQYVSALLIAAPFAAEDTAIVLEGRIPSLPYIALTVETMEAFGVDVAMDGTGRYVVKSGQRYRGREYRIEGDVSSASYFFLAAALCKGRVRVENINPQTRQGDIGFLDAPGAARLPGPPGGESCRDRGGGTAGRGDDLRSGRHARHGADAGGPLGRCGPDGASSGTSPISVSRRATAWPPWSAN